MTGVLNVDTTYGTAVLNGINLHQRWVCCYDLSPLLDDFDVRGSDQQISHVQGVRGYPRRRTATRKELPFLITGWVSYGAPSGLATNRPATLIENIEYLRANIGIGEQDGDGTVLLVWTRPGGSVRQAEVHVSMPHGGLGRPIDSVARSKLVLNFPYAEWIAA